MIETILTAFAVGTFWFWALILIGSGIILGCVENEHYIFPSILSLALIAIYGSALLTFGWKILLIFAVAYVIVGVVWSIFKWGRHIKKAIIEHKERGEEKENSYSYYPPLESKLSVSENKALLTGWIAFWPWSLTWGLTGDFFNMAYESMVGVYQGMVDKQKKKYGIKD